MGNNSDSIGDFKLNCKTGKSFLDLITEKNSNSIVSGSMKSLKGNLNNNETGNNEAGNNEAGNQANREAGNNELGTKKTKKNQAGGKTTTNENANPPEGVNAEQTTTNQNAEQTTTNENSEQATTNQNANPPEGVNSTVSNAISENNQPSEKQAEAEQDDEDANKILEILAPKLDAWKKVWDSQQGKRTKLGCTPILLKDNGVNIEKKIFEELFEGKRMKKIKKKDEEILKNIRFENEDLNKYYQEVAGVDTSGAKKSGNGSNGGNGGNSQSGGSTNSKGGNGANSGNANANSESNPNNSSNNQNSPNTKKTKKQQQKEADEADKEKEQAEEDGDEEDESLGSISLSCTNLGSTRGNSGEYGLRGKIRLDKKNYEMCKCQTFVPTGIFQYDWVYYRKCYQNFKEMIIEAKNSDMKQTDLFETYSKKYFMDDFYSQFGGKFKPYRDKMEEFADNFHKLCRLNRNVLVSNGFVHRQKIKTVVENVKSQMKSAKKKIKKV